MICLGYVEDIFQTFMGANKDELKAAAKELKDKTPPPMNTMIEKQSRGDALEKREARSKMMTQNVPPTTPGILCCLYIVCLFEFIVLKVYLF